MQLLRNIELSTTRRVHAYYLHSQLEVHADFRRIHDIIVNYFGETLCFFGVLSFFSMLLIMIFVLTC